MILLRVGDLANVEVDACTKKQFKGMVTSISPTQQTVL
jgi:multidrug resistance efflux pump